MENHIEQIRLNPDAGQSPLYMSQGKLHTVLGQNIIFAHINHHGFESADVLKKISETIHRGYNEAATSDTEAALERALQSGNYMIAQLVKDVGKEWLSNFNMVAISIKEKEIHFSRTGNLHAFLVFRNEITDLAPVTNENGGNGKNPIKTFTNIITGNVSSNSHIIFCTDSVLDYISLERLKRTILECVPGKREEAFRELLRRAPVSQQFGLLVISRVSSEDITRSTGEEITQSDDIQNRQTYTQVSNTRENHSMIAPPLFPTGTFTPRITKLIKETITQFLQRTQLKPTTGTRLKTYANIRRHSYGLSRNNPLHIKMLHLAKQTMGAVIHIIVALPKMTKLILGLAVIVGIAFIFSLSHTKDANQKTKTNQEYEQQISHIQTLQEQAHATGLYDTNKARELLSQAIALIKQIPEDTQDRLAQKQTIQQTMESELNTLRRLHTIDTPTIFIDLQADDPAINPKDIILTTSELYAYNTVSNTILLVKIADKTVSKFSPQNTITGYLQTAELNGSSIIFYHNNKGLLSFDTKTKSFKPVAIALKPSDQLDIFRIYQTRLYRMDENKATIYRHEKLPEGYGVGDAWNKEPIPILTKTVDMVIDGTIYLAIDDGQIIHLEQGKAKPFETKKIDPKLEKPKKIYTNLTSDFLYILDSGTNRIVILNKQTGELINQYTSSAWSDLRDFAVDEKNHTIYLLNGSVIYTLTY